MKVNDFCILLFIQQGLTSTYISAESSYFDLTDSLFATISISQPWRGEVGFISRKNVSEKVISRELAIVVNILILLSDKLIFISHAQIDKLRLWKSIDIYNNKYIFLLAS